MKTTISKKDIQTVIVYKKYIIEVNQLNGAILVSKNGAHICYAKTVDEAKSSVDLLTE